MRAFLVLAFLSLHVSANDKLPTGPEIANNINARDEGVSVSRKLTMTLTDKRGKTRIRNTQAFRQYQGLDKKTVIFYLSPKNLKDTAFLTFDYADKAIDDDQWLYLPAMRRVRRISASDRGDYFLGTDFTYEDIKLETRVSIDDFIYKTKSLSTEDHLECILVETTAKNKNIAKELGIGRREDCIDPNIWIVRRSVQWNEKGRLQKTIRFYDISQVDGIWTAHGISVENHITGHRTEFQFSDVQYSEQLDDALFTQSKLKRGL